MTEKLSDIARDLADQHGDTYDEALRTVTTYAAQLDVPGTGEGWSAPDVEVDPETADHIVRAYEAASQ